MPQLQRMRLRGHSTFESKRDLITHATGHTVALTANSVYANPIHKCSCAMSSSAGIRPEPRPRVCTGSFGATP